MAKYEALPTTTIQANSTMLNTNELPELVHMEDPAVSVLIDFTKTPTHTILPSETLDHAINEMEINGVHLLLVINNDGFLEGIVSSEDTWGEKPIKIIQERRIHRDQVTVKMIMTPLSEIAALDFAVIKSAKVGNIVKTLSSRKQNYALVISPNANEPAQIIRGIFTTSQVSKQLHTNIADIFNQAESLSELHKRHKE